MISYRLSFALVALCLAAVVLAVPIENENSSVGDDKNVKYVTADGVESCSSRKTDSLSDCIVKILDIMTKRYKNGDPSRKIPQIDPFLVNKAAFQYSNGPISGRISIKNTKVYGFSSAKHEKVDLKTDKDMVKLSSVTRLPRMLITGDYKADVMFNNARLKPKGKFNVTLIDVVIEEESDGELYPKDGHKFLHLNNINSDVKIGGLNLNATGIFEDPELNDLVLNMANQYWKQIYAVVLPETRRFWGPMILRVSNEALANVPFDEFIKDI